MRRYLIILMMPCFVMLFGICCLAGCEGSRHHLKKVRLNEVAHSIFYAPQYVAIEKGYFEKEGIKLELTTGFGADKTATDRKSTRLNSSHMPKSRMPSSA